MAKALPAPNPGDLTLSSILRPNKDGRKQHRAPVPTTPDMKDPNAVMAYLTAQFNNRDIEHYPSSSFPSTGGDTANAQAFSDLDLRKQAIKKAFSKEGITLTTKKKSDR